MPMTISHNSRSGKDSVDGKTMGVFTGGQVWIDFALSAPDISVANVNFAPCARTHWHTHSGGQLLRVMAGSGWVCDKGDTPRRIAVGDVIWCPAGTTHWHGADDGCYMVHQATSLGKVEWLEAVGVEEYAGKGRARKGDEKASGEGGKP